MLTVLHSHKPLFFMSAAALAVASLLQASLALLNFVQMHPELPASSRDYAQHVAQQAITMAGTLNMSTTSAPVATTTASLPPKLVVSSNYVSGATSTTVTVAGGVQNKGVSYWTLSIACDQGLSMQDGMQPKQYCNTLQQYEITVTYDPMQDYDMFSGKIVNSGYTAGSVYFVLSSFDAARHQLGSSNQTLHIPGKAIAL
jgi:hypothetical protein